jgi:hypothetical protein
VHGHEHVVRDVGQIGVGDAQPSQVVPDVLEVLNVEGQIQTFCLHVDGGRRAHLSRPVGVTLTAAGSSVHVRNGITNHQM